MYRGKRILAVVPARGGSKGVPRKNLLPVNGSPIVCIAGLCAKKVTEIDCVVVSTDSDEIAAVAESCGVEAPFRRPESISGDFTGDLEVLEHALKEMEKLKSAVFDVVVMLQPTAPLRTSSQVAKTIRKLIDERLDAVWTVSPTETKYHPHKQLKISDGNLDYCMPEGRKILPRQALEQVYHVNGVAYALTRSCVIDQKNRLGKSTGAVIIKDMGISIDTLEDFRLVEEILQSRSDFETKISNSKNDL